MRRATLRLAGLLAVVALAACARIPTSGTVEAGSNDEAPQQAPVVVLAAGPQPDSQPQQIVNDFLTAGAAGLSNGVGGRPDFTVAREYLYGDAAAKWDPLGGVLIVSDIKVGQPSDTQVTVDASVVGKVDEDGSYSEVPLSARETVTFDLIQDTTGEWRIQDAPDGLILTQRQFQGQFRQVSLFFLTPDETFLVPDPRWYPAVNLATSAVKGLLAGPSPWLRDAVKTEVPQGVALTPEVVTVTNGQAEVDLAPALAVQGAKRDLLVAQIEKTLEQVTQVRSVLVRAGADGPQLQGTSKLTTAGERELPGGPEMITTDGSGADRLVTLADGRLTPVDGVGALTGLEARSPARSEDGTVRALLTGSSVLAIAPTVDQAPATLVQSPGLVAPSVDPKGWVWSASASTVFALDGTSARAQAPVTAQFQPQWLADRQVKAVRVSRDGTRIAVVSTGQDGVVSIDVAGIARDDAGRPQQLSEPAQRVGAALTTADQVVWIDDSMLAVLGRDAGSATVWEVPVGGPSKALPNVAGAVSLAGGRYERSLLVATDTGDLWSYNRPTWTPVTGVTGVRDPSYPG